ncbi:hypothetical protein AN640_05470 [Candidatus Epulonipiscium fishelsonii]|uniref:Uncharacterized protein n=1 Tax=Candidatus Epulonipiscium fishelsonii TaxID=77094 RepID=A0ACC8XHY7_9FIRM|nr:hypothetical protein AN640_05470 [Epulopiscium sp. SCG-D08WGA-EpuloA1]
MVISNLFKQQNSMWKINIKGVSSNKNKEDKNLTNEQHWMKTQIESIQNQSKQDKIAAIYDKAKNGEPLTEAEKELIKGYSPEMYERVLEYEKMHEEVEKVKEKLDNAESKEEVHSITNGELVKAGVAAETGIDIITAMGILEEIDKFMKGVKYQNLPVEDEEYSINKENKENEEIEDENIVEDVTLEETIQDLTETNFDKTIPDTDIQADFTVQDIDTNVQANSAETKTTFNKNKLSDVKSTLAKVSMEQSNHKTPYSSKGLNLSTRSFKA